MKTIATVIGNNSYQKSAELVNAVNDATEIARVFENLRFEVSLIIDFKSENIPNILEELTKKTADYDASIFYFAGHGFELDGENYLASVDCQIPPSSGYYANINCIKLNDLLAVHKANSNKANIVIIDACRKQFNRSGTQSFAPVTAPKGSFIAFSTSPNESASDGCSDSKNSVYTKSLLDCLTREEKLSIEELFKKVRKTVYTLTEGQQTPWEHTSLINDYFFNLGQRVYSKDILYQENVVKDGCYDEVDYFGGLIKDLKSYNWHTQNPAITKLLNEPLNTLDVNKQFLLGRNILQTSGYANNAKNFMEKISTNIEQYTDTDGENHFLNGMLFEIYFDSNGVFRENKTKKYFLEEIFLLRKTKELEKSFLFIQNLLSEQKYPLIYIPEQQDKYIDVQVLTSEKNINKISYNNIDITKEIASYHLTNKANYESLTTHLTQFLSAPRSLININSKTELDGVFCIIDRSEQC